MKLEELYIKCRQYYSGITEEEKTEVNMQQLADQLFYTLRNMRVLLKKMDALGWITWIPGRGRGNMSSLIFHRSLEDAQLQLFKAMIFDGRENEAFARVETEAPSIKMTLTSWYYQSKFIVYYDPAVNRQFVRIRELITKENVDVYCHAIKTSLKQAVPGFTILIDMLNENINTPDVENEMEELRQLVTAKGVKAIALYTSSTYLIPYLEKRLNEMGTNKIFPDKQSAEAYLDSL